MGSGKLGPGGLVSYRGILYDWTSSQKLARLNKRVRRFEYEVDPTRNTTAKVWERK